MRKNAATRIRSTHPHGTSGMPVIRRRFRMSSARSLITGARGNEQDHAPLWVRLIPRSLRRPIRAPDRLSEVDMRLPHALQQHVGPFLRQLAATVHVGGRSEEHTSELQSLMRISYAVFCLKKKNNHK